MAKGYSLHVGLNRVEASCYDDNAGVLNVCVNDLVAMYDIAVKQGFSESICLKNEDATKEKFIQEMKGFAQKTEPGDLFLLTYSGHGSQTKDGNGDEQDGWDENMCLYDGRYVDDKLNELFCEFKPQVRILMIADCCHGGTLLKNGFKKVLVSRKKKTKKLPKPKASIILIASTADNQAAFEGPFYGRFTEILLKVWDDGNYTKSYEEFKDAIFDIQDSRQIPVLNVSGNRNTDFHQQSPFQI